MKEGKKINAWKILKRHIATSWKKKFLKVMNEEK
jgi:hypothetical protein